MFESPHGMSGLFKPPESPDAPQPPKETQPSTPQGELSLAQARLELMNRQISQARDQDPSDPKLRLYQIVAANIERHIASLEKQISEASPADPPEQR